MIKFKLKIIVIMILIIICWYIYIGRFIMLKRKTLFPILALIMLLSVFVTACGGTNNASSNKTTEATKAPSTEPTAAPEAS